MSNQSENQTSAKLKQNLDIEATVLTVKSSTDNILRHFIPNPSRAISKSLPILLNCFLEKVPISHLLAFSQVSTFVMNPSLPQKWRLFVSVLSVWTVIKSR